MDPHPLHVGFLVYPHVTQLDLTAPAQAFATLDDVRLHFVWKSRGPVCTDAGFDLVATASFDDCPPLDVLCVPGGAGQARLMQDAEVLGWLARQGEHAAWVTSVCSGSLLLGAAGLLRGRRAASHWNYRHLLAGFGAVPDPARVVRDGNRVTGGGVTAGLDLALHVIAAIRGEPDARMVQLLLEYAPEPPFAGRPDEADPDTVERVRTRLRRALESLPDVG
jgi:cyclohexyl-isocyanide hydratase